MQENSFKSDAAEPEPLPEEITNSAEELILFLTEDGEARRRFLKQALIAGGGLAAANLLLDYHVASAQTGVTADLATSSHRLRLLCHSRIQPHPRHLGCERQMYRRPSFGHVRGTRGSRRRRTG